jgi:hypothetical protein
MCSRSLPLSSFTPHLTTQQEGAGSGVIWIHRLLGLGSLTSEPPDFLQVQENTSSELCCISLCVLVAVNAAVCGKTIRRHNCFLRPAVNGTDLFVVK